MKTLSIYTPDKYYDQIEALAEENNVTKSEAFRRIQGLNEAEFNITFSAREKPLLRYVQTIVLIMAGFLDYTLENVHFWSTKERKNYKRKKAFYTFIYKQVKMMYDYFDKTILTACDKGFEEMSDTTVTEQADNVEAIAYLLEHGTASDWALVRAVSDKIKGRKYGTPPIYPAKK